MLAGCLHLSMDGRGLVRLWDSIYDRMRHAPDDLTCDVVLTATQSQLIYDRWVTARQLGTKGVAA